MSDDVIKSPVGSPKLPPSLLLNKLTSPSAKSPEKPVIKRAIKVNNELASPSESSHKSIIDLDSIIIEKTNDVKSPIKSPVSSIPASKMMGKTVVSPSIKSTYTSPKKDVASPTILPSLINNLPRATISSVRKKLDEIVSSDSESSSGSETSAPPSTTRSKPPSTRLTHRKIIQPLEETKITSMPFSLDSINSPREENTRMEVNENVISSRKETPRGRLLADEPEVQIIDEEDEIINSALRNKSETPKQKLSTPQKQQDSKPSTVDSWKINSNVEDVQQRVQNITKPIIEGKPSYVQETQKEDELTEEEERLLLIARFKILKRGWPDIPVPEHEGISLKQLRKIYELYKARIFAEECAGGYKKWLIAMFVIVEVVTVRFLGLNMDGFTINQLNSMNTYQDLLLELAEKYGEQTQSQFSVETRLIFAVGMNAVIFFGLKYVFGDVNPETSKMIANALGGKGDTSGMGGLLGGLVSTLSGSGSSKSESGGLGPPPPRRRRKEG